MIRLALASWLCEWRKQRRSLASWLVIVGGFFVPTILLASRLWRSKRLPGPYQDPAFWEVLYRQAWQIMAILLLPMGIILATGLITQLEHRDNAWKQLHTTPQPLGLIFATKLMVLLSMMVQLFILFHVGIFLVGIVPALFVPNVFLPVEPYPVGDFAARALRFFADLLPIVAGQYLLCLMFRNFLVPLGVGLAMLIASVMAFSWEWNVLLPYGYAGVDYLGWSGQRAPWRGPWSTPVTAVAIAIVIVGAAYVGYLTKRDRS